MKKRLMLLSVLLLTITSSLLLGAGAGAGSGRGGELSVDDLERLVAQTFLEDDLSEKEGGWDIVDHATLLKNHTDDQVLIINATPFFLNIQLGGDNCMCYFPEEGSVVDRTRISGFGLSNSEDFDYNELIDIDIDLLARNTPVCVFFWDTRARAIQIMQLTFTVWKNTMLEKDVDCQPIIAANRVVTKMDDLSDGSKYSYFNDFNEASATAAGEEGKEGDEAV